MGEDACAAGWKARTRKQGCYLGSRIVGTAAKKGEQGYIAPVQSVQSDEDPHEKSESRAGIPPFESGEERRAVDVIL